MGTIEDVVPFSSGFLRIIYRGFAVNRKQRRMAAKLGTQVPAPLSRNATIIASGQIADLLTQGRRHHQAGQFTEAENCYRKLLAIDPSHFDGLHLLGVIAQQTGRSELAARFIGKAIALHDHLGRHDARTAHPNKAAISGHDLAAAHSNLCIVLRALGDLPEALKAVQRSLRIAETENAKLLFVGCLRNLAFIPEGINLRDDLARAISEPWGRPTDLARFTSDLIKHSGAIGTCIRRIAATGSPVPAQHDLFSPTELAEICNDRLLCCLLESTIVFDFELEQFLTAVRRAILAAAAGNGPQAFEQRSLRFACAVAQQCVINEYVFRWTDEEKLEAEHLRARLIETLATGAALPEPWLVAVATYFPLASLPQADLLLKRHWSAAVDALVARQVREVHEEQQLRASIPRLTAIDAGVSLAVRQQYEENPYPRWIKASPDQPNDY